MKLKRIFTLCLAAVLLLTASGCQLAREDGVADDTPPDKFIGVFITKEYVSLFDSEGYLNANLDKINVGGTTVLEGDRSAYEGRLYATLVSEPITSEETGETRNHYKYVFEDVEGFPHFIPLITDPEAGDSYYSPSYDEAVSVTQLVLTGGDEEKLELAGTIYYDSSISQIKVYINPVYQTSDGEVYLINGSGMTLSDQTGGSGGKFTQTLEETTTTAVDGEVYLTSGSSMTSSDQTGGTGGRFTQTVDSEEKSYSCKVVTSVALIDPPEKIAVVQLDADSAIVSRTEYEPGTLPETLIVEAGTEYIIVETFTHSNDGEEIIVRDMYNSDDTTATDFNTFTLRDDGICILKYTALDWGK